MILLVARRLLVCPGSNRQHPAAAGIRPRREVQEGAACGIVRHRLIESNTCRSGLLIRWCVTAGRALDAAAQRLAPNHAQPDQALTGACRLSDVLTSRRHLRRRGTRQVRRRYTPGPSQVTGDRPGREPFGAGADRSPDTASRAIRTPVRPAALDEAAWRTTPGVCALPAEVPARRPAVRMGGAPSAGSCD